MIDAEARATKAWSEFVAASDAGQSKLAVFFREFVGAIREAEAGALEGVAQAFDGAAEDALRATPGIDTGAIHRAGTLRAAAEFVRSRARTPQEKT